MNVNNFIFVGRAWSLGGLYIGAENRQVLHWDMTDFTVRASSTPPETWPERIYISNSIIRHPLSRFPSL